MQTGALLRLATILLSLCRVAAAFGGPVTFEFAGEVTYIDDDHGILGGGIEIGDSFLAAYTFESDTPDAAPGVPTLGAYIDPVNEIAGNVGDLALTGPAGFGNHIRVFNDVTDLVVDVYLVTLDVQLDDTLLTLLLDIRDKSATVFNDDSLPATLPGADSFEHRGFAMFNLPGTLLIRGTVTSIVPEPTTLALLAVGWSITMGARCRSPRYR